METATSEKLYNSADDEELKRFCKIFAVAQSNMIYRILSAKDKAEMMERIKEETEVLMPKMRLAGTRGGEKCGDGQVWDEALQKCV